NDWTSAGLSIMELDETSMTTKASTIELPTSVRSNSVGLMICNPFRSTLFFVSYEPTGFGDSGLRSNNQGRPKMMCSTSIEMTSHHIWSLFSTNWIGTKQRSLTAIEE
ncbi:Hypothetical predicted protein, partial [Olea europaea subsp. europaea]